MSESEPPDNARARALRVGLPETNGFDLPALAAQPPFWGWVGGTADRDISFRMLLAGGDDGVALRFFWNGHYERATLRLWTHFARAASLALDVGAHTGVYTLAARAANPALNVLSFEPHWANFARLTVNLRANGFATTDAYLLAVGQRDETRAFTVPTHPDYLSTGGGLGARPQGVTAEVRVVALDSFLPTAVAAQVDLVKLDVEGWEAACLDGMAGVLASARPTVFFECLDAAAVAETQARLTPHGYRIFEIDDDSRSVREVTDAAGLAPAPQRRNRVAAVRPQDVTRIETSLGRAR